MNDLDRQLKAAVRQVMSLRSPTPHIYGRVQDILEREGPQNTEGV